MGKKKVGGSGSGGGAKRPSGVSSSSGSSLVVVNPMIMQSALHAAAVASSGSKRPAKAMHKQKPKSKKRSLGTSDALSSGASGGSSSKKTNKKSKTMHDRDSSFERKPSKRAQKSPVVSTSVVSAMASAGLSGDDDRKAPIALVVPTKEHMLAGAYWVALSRAAKRSCVVVVPNTHESLTPQRIAATLRHLGLQAIAIHKKMTAGQRKESIERLASSAQQLSDASQLLLVTPEHFAGGAVCALADVLLVDVAMQQQQVAKAAAIFEVRAAGDAANTYRPELRSTVLQQVVARVKLATQLTEIAERLALTNAKDVETKWASKLARGAGLDSDDGDDDGDDDNSVGGKKGKKKKRALSPDEQRLQALAQKLAVLVARKLDVSVAKPGATQPSSESSAAAVSGGGGDNQHAKEKLEVLGLVTLTAAVGAAMGDERFSAQTQWMDGASGRQFGGAWDGTVRHGASKDATSLAVRTQLCAVRQQRSKRPASAKTDAKDPSALVLSQWEPNRNPADVDKWGGEFGKVCGHNEIVMQALRPFFPQEVLNSRVCSRVFPAPGNQGFDGCLEHLRLQCLAHARAMTLWDADCFIYISAEGRVTWTRKNQLLGLSLAGLQCLVANLRRWTLASNGQLPPAHVLQALQLCCALGSGSDAAQSSPRLEPKLLKRVMSFALGGSARLWKQIATKVPVRLESEVVY